MSSQFIENHRNGAEITRGDELCRKKSIQFLEEFSLPKGLFPLQDIEEFGYNSTAGFIWFVQKKKKDHTFKKIKQVVSYASEVTAFVEKGKLKKITGVKTKELLLWLTVVEVYLDNASSEKITFKTGTGLLRASTSQLLISNSNYVMYNLRVQGMCDNDGFAFK